MNPSEEREELVLRSENRHLREIAADKPGSGFASIGAGRSAMDGGATTDGHALATALHMRARMFLDAHQGLPCLVMLILLPN
jgi:hypothetical protein